MLKARNATRVQESPFAEVVTQCESVSNFALTKPHKIFLIRERILLHSAYGVIVILKHKKKKYKNQQNTFELKNQANDSLSRYNM